MAVWLEKQKKARNSITEKAVPLAKKEIMGLNEQLKTMLLKNLMSAKSAKPMVEKSLIGRLAKIIGSPDDLVKIVFSDYPDWIGLLHNATEAGMAKVFAEAGKIALAQVGASVSFNLQNPRALDHLNTHALENSQSYAGTMKDEISLVLMEGVEEGQSIDEIAANLAGFFDTGSDWKAERLARTETADAYSQGNLEGFRQSNVVSGKSWVAYSGTTDDVCVGNADAGVIPLDDDFPSGDDAPPGHPNCECALMPSVGSLSNDY